MSLWAAGAGVLGLVWLASRRRRRRAVVVVETPTPVVVEPPVAVEPPPSERLLEIESLLGEFVSDTPRPGFFYQIKRDDTIASITRTALNTVGPHAEPARLSYMHCLQSGPNWNMRIYGTPSVTKTFPKEYLVPGINTGVRIAFLPRNVDAHALMLQGIQPKIAVDPKSGAPGTMNRNVSEPIFPTMRRHYGLLWLPPVDEDSLASGDPTCAPFSWDDDSSTIDPPPQLLELLETS